MLKKETLKARFERHREWLGDETTKEARNKLFLCQALTQKESEELFIYVRKLENMLDKIIEERYN